MATETFLDIMREALFMSVEGLQLSPVQDLPRETLRVRLTIGGEGVQGVAQLTCTRAFLVKTCPLPIKRDEDLRDWLGELGNLLLGRLKNRLLARGLTIRITPPRFDSNETIDPTHKSLTLKYAQDAMALDFSCYFSGEIPAIGPLLEQKAEILPGDAIYRLNDTDRDLAKADIIAKVRSGQFAGQDSDEDEDESPRPEVRQTPASTAPRGPVRVVFHAKSASVQSVTWPQVDRIQIRFSSGTDVTLAPQQLLNRGSRELQIEGLTLHLSKEGEDIKLEIPEIGLSLKKSSRAAS